MEHRPVDISGITRDVIRLCRRTFDPSVKLDLHIQPGLSVRGDRSQLDQVLMNLLMNAKDAITDRGKIRIEVGVQDGRSADMSNERMRKYAVVSVSDDGAGMDEATRLRVFEPFFTTKEVGSGTGLGLAMVYGIVRSHGGEVRVTSRPDQGAKFEVFLPLEEANCESEATDSEISAPMPHDKGLVLVVDDEELYLRSACRMLEQAGYQVVTAANGEDALSLFSRMSHSIQMVVIDLVMPGMSSAEVCAKMKATAADTHVLIMSGYSDKDRLAELENCGNSGFIHKPFNRQMLEFHILDILSKERRTTIAA